jgi:hypothetical protein
MNATTRPLGWPDVPQVTAFLESLTSPGRATLTAEQARAIEPLAIAAYQAYALALAQHGIPWSRGADPVNRPPLQMVAGGDPHDELSHLALERSEARELGHTLPEYRARLVRDGGEEAERLGLGRG